MRLRRKKIKVQLGRKFFFGLIVFLLIVFLARSFKDSLIFKKKGRINLVFYGRNTGFYSLGLQDEVNYFIPFYPDLEISIPGSYGRYRLGAIGKLVQLEKEPEIIKRTFTSLTSTFIDLYFYPSKAEVYFGKEEKDMIFLPHFFQIFLDRSNASFLDRLSVFFLFLGKNKSHFRAISLPVTTGDFFSSYGGFFYQKTYRIERRNVQILYTKSYKTAENISKILEGEGIRVVDISQIKVAKGDCQVFEQAKNFSQTAKSMASFFGCQLHLGKVEAYDIILKLGDIEKDWEID